MRIENKKILRDFINADKKAMRLNGRNLFVEWLKGNREKVFLMYFIIRLRKYEYIINRYKNKGGFINSLTYVIAKHRFASLRMKNNLFISPNVFGPGLQIVHHGYYWIDEQSKIGSGCTLYPNLLFGNKYAGNKNNTLSSPFIILGDNCSIGTGSVILGPVKIGDNVIIGAGSVVINDIPGNSIVAGNPAKVLKMNTVPT